MSNLDIATNGFTEENKASKAFKSLLNNILLLSILISVAFFSFSYMFIDVKVMGPSMQPTVNAQWSPSEQHKQDVAYIKKGSSFARGDIIVIEPSEDLYVIKRLIAVEGDKVNIIENLITEEIELYVNDELLVEDYVVYKAGMNSTLNNFNNLRVNSPEFFVGDDLVVPQNFVFYLGDNRGQSQDCSFYGPVEKTLVVGSANLIIPYGQTFVGYMWQEFKALFN